MEHIRLMSNLSEHPKWLATSPPGCKVLIALWCYCGRNETDGRVPAAAARREGLTTALARQLEELGWIHRDDEAWVVHDWSEHQIDAAEIRDRRERQREAWRRLKSTQRKRRRSKPKEGESTGVSTVDTDETSNETSSESPPQDVHDHVPGVSFAKEVKGTPVETPLQGCPTGVHRADEPRAVSPLEGGGPRSSALNGAQPEPDGAPDPPGEPLSDELVAAMAPTNAVMAALAERRRLAALAEAQRPTPDDEGGEGA
jgi:hypothetical protein